MRASLDVVRSLGPGPLVYGVGRAASPIRRHSAGGGPTVARDGTAVALRLSMTESVK